METEIKPHKIYKFLAVGKRIEGNQTTHHISFKCYEIKYDVKEKERLYIVTDFTDAW